MQGGRQCTWRPGRRSSAPCGLRGSWPGTLDAVAADAHGDLAFAGLGVALDLLRVGRQAPSRTRQRPAIQGRQQLVHFAQTIKGGPGMYQLGQIISATSSLSTTATRRRAIATMKFHGTKNYVATQDLMLSVNAAITLKRPLLVKGEPGTGKTMLAEEVAPALNLPLLQWHIKSTTKAQQGLYEYDAVSRLRDSQLGDEKRQGHPQLHRQRRAVAGLHRRRAGGAADRRDRQGRHRVSERPAARNRPHGVLLLRNPRADHAPSTGRWCSSPPTTKRNCPTPFCAAASSTTSSSPTPTR